eukprot:CAMPEP_0116574598 /NCGR_PEP_ID=MMETSP0397-20121206/19486_1 /TAXON_ID=216820 /ORGANISM="Cyclophora tenuis, Strain ECT3854" /LENGTH=357 /DNA_ID=CAMNT_0004103387 /DNA_START=31 /DNA_END=1104 /DNA_ORIENTATION=+
MANMKLNGSKGAVYGKRRSSKSVIYLIAGVIGLCVVMMKINPTRGFDAAARSLLPLDVELLAKSPAITYSNPTGNYPSPGLDERMKLYRKRYRYLEPSPRTAATAFDCGAAPAYANYFAMDSTLRSLWNEDRLLFDNFFHSFTRKGVFVEMGAYNGLQQSNSRFFDDCLGWEGLLVEPNPLLASNVTGNRPHAHKLFYAPSCSKEEEAAKKTIVMNAVQNYTSSVKGIVHDKEAMEASKVHVPCGTLTDPLIDLLKGQTIDLFSLDVESAEPTILRNLDLDAVRVNIFMVESWNRMCKEECESRDQVRAIFRKYNYMVYPDLIPRSDVYIHPAYHQQISEEWKSKNSRLPLVRKLRH